MSKIASIDAPNCMANITQREAVLCPHCDMLVTLPPMKEGSRAQCPRCHSTLMVRWASPSKRAIGYALSAIFILFIACAFPFVTMNVSGIENSITLFNIPSIMLQQGYLVLAVLYFIFVFIFPVAALIAILFLHLPFIYSQKLKIRLAKLLFWLKVWCMAEIFLVGVLVSFVKLTAYGEIHLGLGFIPYCLFCLLLIRSLQCIDRYYLWQSIAPAPDLPITAIIGETGINQGLKLCRCCHGVIDSKTSHCPRCHQRVHMRMPQSIQMTLALLITSLILYVPSNLLPIMITQTMGSDITSTIMEGVIILWEDNSQFVALVIFIASIMVPTLKMIALTWLCLISKKENRVDRERMHLIYAIVEFVGRWSMIDVFVIAVLSALVSMGRLMGIFPAPGAILFAIVVILTMLAALTFDPRLIWDCQKKEDKETQRAD